MIFNETELKGAWVIEPIKFEDHRGTFSRFFCSKEFKDHGLTSNFVQGNISKSTSKHTLRGMHLQINGAEEVKLIRCVKGAILDVVIDLRKDSSTYCNHYSVELNDKNDRQLYVPKGFAHGFITLESNVEVSYLVSEFYSPEKEIGIRWNDPIFNIQWPTNTPILSEKDKNHPNYIR